jgi:hypothetical protein
MQTTLAPRRIGLRDLEPGVQSVASENLVTASAAASAATKGGQAGLSAVLGSRYTDSPGFGIAYDAASKPHAQRTVPIAITRDGLGDLWRLIMIIAGVVLTVGWTAGLSWLLLWLLLSVV